MTQTDPIGLKESHPVRPPMAQSRRHVLEQTIFVNPNVSANTAHIEKFA
jgi:hypothetical protein